VTVIWEDKAACARFGAAGRFSILMSHYASTAYLVCNIAHCNHRTSDLFSYCPASLLLPEAELEAWHSSSQSPRFPDPPAAHSSSQCSGRSCFKSVTSRSIKTVSHSSSKVDSLKELLQALLENNGTGMDISNSRNGSIILFQPLHFEHPLITVPVDDEEPFLVHPL